MFSFLILSGPVYGFFSQIFAVYPSELCIQLLIQNKWIGNCNLREVFRLVEIFVKNCVLDTPKVDTVVSFAVLAAISIFYFAPYSEEYESKIFIKWAISDVFFLPDVCQLSSRHIDKYVHATEGEIIFWPNCSKFAVENAWNSKIPQNVRSLGLLQKKIDVFFWGKSWIFSKSLKVQFCRSIRL